MDVLYYNKHTMRSLRKVTENTTFTVDSAYIYEVVSALTKYGYVVRYKPVNRFYYNVWITKKETMNYDSV